MRRTVLAAAWVAGLAAALGAEPKATPSPKPSPSPSPAVTAPPRPAELVPPPPFVGTPAAGEKPYREILRAKAAGASEAALLEKVRKDGRTYSLTTSEIQELRSAGVPAKVVEAMLKSGRAPRTPVPTPSASAAPATPR